MGEASLAIERMCFGGAGFGRVEGKACFVPFTAPGDLALIKVVKEKRSYLEGELVDLRAPSPLRVAPVCPVFGRCGGCNWQHLGYEEQLKQKGEIFADSLRRIGKVEVDDILPVLPSLNRYGYRSRIQLKVAWQNGAPSLGFYRTGSHQVIDLSGGCAIAAPQLNAMAAELRSLLTTLPRAQSIAGIDLSLGDQGEGIAVLHLTAGTSAHLVEKLSGAHGELPSVAGLFLSCGKPAELEHAFGVTSLSYRIPAHPFAGSREVRLRFSRGGFSQVNFAQNVELVSTVCRWGGFTGKERVLDLYCGNGNLSVPVAPLVREVVGIEGYAPSIEDAIANAADNGVTNASFQVSDAARAVRRLVKRQERFDLVILDPPRGGAEAAGEIAQLAADKIIYISCDPTTLSRDLPQLAQKGYRVTRSQPVDMFPHTYHLESVTELTRL